VIKNTQSCFSSVSCIPFIRVFPLSGPVSASQLRASEWERVSSKWLSVEAELLRERAVFGPGPGVLLSRDWEQDAAEGPNRTRSRIRKKALRRSKQVYFSFVWDLGSGVLFSVEPISGPYVVPTGARNAVSGFKDWHVRGQHK